MAAVRRAERVLQSLSGRRLVGSNRSLVSLGNLFVKGTADASRRSHRMRVVCRPPRARPGCRSRTASPGKTNAKETNPRETRRAGGRYWQGGRKALPTGGSVGISPSLGTKQGRSGADATELASRDASLSGLPEPLPGVRARRALE